MKTKMIRGLIAACLMALLTTATACDSAPAQNTDGGSDAGMARVCNGTTLCTRALGECGVTTINMAECEGFYSASASCTDVAAYESCNCDCDADNGSCGGWFSCGEACFATHCM